MKTVEEKKNERLPKYITNKELEELLDSDEMNRLVELMDVWEKYKDRTKDISVGEY